jgi:DNA-binding NarL/FixJ family response regulator
VTKFVPADDSVSWDIASVGELCNGYSLLFASGSSYEAYLFALISKLPESAGNLIGAATSVQEAVDLINEVGGAPLICLLSDSIGLVQASEISLHVQASIKESISLLIVSDLERFHAISDAASFYNACCSASSVGRGGLSRCLEYVLRTGQSFLDPVLITEIGSIHGSGLSSLTSREREIACLLAEGLSNKELAARLFIAERTARDYVASILSKLGLPNRAAAASWAARRGLLP